MPTYAYACTSCDHRFDASQSFSDAALTVCPKCEGRLRKVFSAVGIVFKGSGFYRTDSRSGAGKEAGAPAGNGTKPGGKDKADDSSGGSGKDFSSSGKESSGAGSGKDSSRGSSATKQGDKTSAPAAAAS